MDISGYGKKNFPVVHNPRDMQHPKASLSELSPGPKWTSKEFCTTSPWVKEWVACEKSWEEYKALTNPGPLNRFCCFRPSIKWLPGLRMGVQSRGQEEMGLP